MKLPVPFGTRPGIVKLAPVVRALRADSDPATPAAQRRADSAPCPNGDGRTDDRGVEVLHATGAALLEPAEPDFVDQEPPC
ncbi:hypothetical protein [Pseudonocardia humida]|uniref:Uncharacterized protein n=1 Tax=Pseudonocardia humida TaxID=2800819 RepID=A0ABT1A4C3_9PSEU|nr:hypothetical protein [Pseudonocardia humida]MCO1657852.1 hypothetical protein [Pseudonocardia humida]